MFISVCQEFTVSQQLRGFIAHCLNQTVHSCLLPSGPCEMWKQLFSFYFLSQSLFYTTVIHHDSLDICHVRINVVNTKRTYVVRFYISFTAIPS